MEQGGGGGGWNDFVGGTKLTHAQIVLETEIGTDRLDIGPRVGRISGPMNR